MKLRNHVPMTITGTCCGILFSFAFINPYAGRISLSELVLQFSGASGVFTPGISLTELLSFSAKMIPYFLFELYFGISLYRHFCTAGVYVFSRTADRVLWYAGECLTIILADMLYQTAYLLSAIAAACLRYEVLWDLPGAGLLAVHALLYSFWAFAMTLLVNLLSLGFGSETAFAVTFGGQALLIVLLSSLRLFENDAAAYTFLLNADPMSRLVVGWHSAAVEWTGAVVPGIEGSLSFFASFAYVALAAAVVWAAGAVCVQRWDLIAADPEFGGF